MEDILSNVNWIAVVAGAVVSFLTAWLWYSPKLFGEGWAEGVKVKLEPDDEPEASSLLLLFVGLFLLSWFIGILNSKGMLLTAILGVAAFILIEYAGGMFMKHSRYSRLTDAGFWVVCAVIMIASQVIL